MYFADYIIDLFWISLHCFSKKKTPMNCYTVHLLISNDAHVLKSQPHLVLTKTDDVFHAHTFILINEIKGGFQCKSEFKNPSFFFVSFKLYSLSEFHKNQARAKLMWLVCFLMHN